MTHPNNKLSTSHWHHFTNQISFSKQTVQELSKLYIIIHEKLKSSIKKCVLDPKKPFSQQANYHIQFIKNILDKIKDTKNDQYLAQVETDLLAKYQKNFIALLNQIQIMLKVQESHSNLNFSSLKSIKPQKRSKHDLKSEVFESNKRITRAKSGYKNRKSQNQTTTDFKTKKNDESQGVRSFLQTNSSQKLNRKNSNFDIQNETDLQIAFQQKQEAIGSKMQNSMSKTSNGLGVSFQKKYENNYLEMYLNQRKQFADLIFNQQVYNKIIHQNQEDSKELNRSDSNSPSKMLKMEEVNNKLFPQFQIKTKFMKPNVKSKISSLITEIKKDLLQLYMTQNVEMISSLNDNEKKALNQKKKTLMPTLNVRSQSLKGFTRRDSLQTIQQNYERRMPTQEQKGKFSQTEYATNFHDSPKRLKKFQSVHLLNKKQIFGNKTKKSFVNPNPRPFYETQKWNEEIQKKYENKILSKLILAKI